MGFLSLVSTVSHTVVKHYRGKIPNSHYQHLQETPFLHGSDYLKQLAQQAVKNKDEAKVQFVVDHIKRYDVGDIKSYKSVINWIKENVDVTDIIF